MLMILSGQPSISFEWYLSDTLQGTLIWSNLILDLKETLKFHINFKSNCWLR